MNKLFGKATGIKLRKQATNRGNQNTLFNCENQFEMVPICCLCEAQIDYKFRIRRSLLFTTIQTAYWLQGGMVGGKTSYLCLTEHISLGLDCRHNIQPHKRMHIG